MNIFGRTLLIPLFLAAGMLASCSSFLEPPTLSQADKMETAISTVGTALASTQSALPTPSLSPSREPSNTPRPSTRTETASPVPTSTEEATFTPGPTLLPIVSPEVIAWEETISLPIASSAPFNDARGQQLIFHNGYVYIFGGAGIGEPSLTNVYFSTVRSDGTLVGWVETTSLPGKYYDHVVVRTGEYVYLLTGAAGAEDVYYAPFHADGSIGAWKKTASLSPSRQQFAAVSHGNFIYSTGGNSGGNQTFVQYTSVRPDGSLNNWSLTAPLPDRIQAHTMLAYNGYIYVFGGKNASEVWVTNVYYSAIQPNGTLADWKTTTPMPRQRSSYSTFESNGYVYLIGGSSISSYYTRILENHALDAWKEAASLPNNNIHGLRTGAYNGFAYAMGGYKGGYQSTVYYGFIGSIQPPESPTPAPETETTPRSSTPAPQRLTPDPLTCQLNINQNSQVNIIDKKDNYTAAIDSGA
jgi:N-acetylneuraminic acid mutarotase